MIQYSAPHSYSGSNLEPYANLSGANLHDAYLLYADLAGADLTDADLSNANLYQTDLHDATLTGANLYQLNLAESDLNGAILTNTTLTGADVTNTTLTGTTFSLGTTLYDGQTNEDSYSFGSRIVGNLLRLHRLRRHVR